MAAGASVTSVEQLIGALKAASSAADVVRSLLATGDRELLKRCAAVRSFDAELFELLRSDVPEDSQTTLEQLVADGNAVPVPGREGVFRLPDVVRADHLEQWWRDEPSEGAPPPALARLSRRLVAFYEDPKHAEPVEALYHRFAVDPDAALACFVQLYDDADTRFDLARCRDLVDTFGERRRLVGPSRSEVRNDYRRYLDARGIWIDDWFRTARFLQQAATKEPIERLLAGDTTRVLQIWARGGMGKTMLLRWLIARRCVPKPERIACARIDFDDIDVVAATHEPWLILLEAAAQVNRQLRDAPFQELLRQHGQHRARLQRRPLVERGAMKMVLPSTETADRALADDVRERFAGTLAEFPQSERVLVVLDTLEVGLFLGDPVREHQALLPLLRELAALCEDAPSLRLLLASRHDLGHRIEVFPSLFPTAESLELTGFSEEESRRYLVEKRHLERPDLVEAAARAGAGVPFKLALIADALEQCPEVTPDELDEYEDADILYLIQRVVERVEPGVQWLLRYGVVPDVLDRAFVREVMRPYLRAGMSGTGGGDTPRDDPVPAVRGRPPVERWPTDLLEAGADPDVDDVWLRLKRYVGRASWVDLEHGEAEAVRFHPEVRNPMRRILSRQRVFRDLNRDACGYFERRAADDPQGWARWIREAVFHRFQLEGPQAASYWRAQLESSRQRGPEDCRELALDLLGDDYLEEGDPRTWRDGQPLIDKATLLEARYEVAWAGVQIARANQLPATHSAWHEAEQAITAVEDEQRSCSKPVVEPARIARVRGSIHLAQEQYDDARAEIARALTGPLPDAERLELHVEYGEALSGRGDPEALASFDAALGLAEDASSRSLILFKIASEHAASDDLERALAACDEAIRTSGTPSGQFALLQAEVNLRLGRTNAAIDAAAAARRTEGPAAAPADFSETRAWRAALRPARALMVATHIVAALEDTFRGAVGSIAHVQLAAEAFDLRGAVLADLMDVDNALADMTRAAELWSTAGSLDAACASHAARAAFQLRELGDAREARVSARQSLRAGRSADGSAWVTAALLEAEVAAWLGRDAEARAEIDSVLDRLEATGAPPRRIVEAALAWLSLPGGTSGQRYLPLLNAHLGRIRPPAARLGLLAPLARCRSFASQAPVAIADLRRLVPSPWAQHDDFRGFTDDDLAVLAFSDVELDRLVLGGAAAAEKLERLLPLLLERDEPKLALRRWLEAARRTGARIAPTERELDVIQAVEAPGSSPALDAALIILGALVHGGPLNELLHKAARLLEQEQGPMGQWPAVLNEALAGVAQERGDRDEAGARARFAADLYGKLGDEWSQDRVLAEFRESQVTPEPSSSEQAPLMTALELSPDGIVAETSLSGEVVSRQWDGPENPIVRALARRARVIPGDATPWSLPSELPRLLLADWEALGLELGVLLLGGVGSARRFADLPERADFALRIHDFPLHVVPWELARSREALVSLDLGFGCLYRTTPHDSVDPEDVRALQIALRRLQDQDLGADGILGPQTRSALARFQEATELRPTGEPDALTEHRLHAVLVGDVPTVTVVRPSLQFEERAYRGSTQASAPIERLYEYHGFAVTVLHEVKLEHLSHELRKRPATIIHISAGLVDSGGTAVLDFASDWAPGELPVEASMTPGRLTSPALDQLLRGHVPRPIVILDPPAPRTVVEVANQLCLRNAFAADLFTLGNVRAVLGTGLARYESQARLYGLLVAGLASGATLGEVTNVVRRVAVEDPAKLEHLIAFAAPALFARSTAIAVPPTD